VKDIHDVITHAKFGDDRLKGSGVVAGQISAFPIDFAGRPYNTLRLPCERVIELSGAPYHQWGPVTRRSSRPIVTPLRIVANKRTNEQNKETQNKDST